LNALRETLSRMLNAFAYANADSPRDVLALLARRDARSALATRLRDKPESARNRAGGALKTESSAPMAYDSKALPR